VKASNSAPHHEKARPYSIGHEVKSTRDMLHLKGGTEAVPCYIGEPTLALQAGVLWAILLVR
jgi:hypothetical protein